MQTVIYNRDKIPFSNTGCVMALGFFDGVHLAHRRLISDAKAEAVRLGLPLAVFSFFSEGGRIKSSTRLYSTEDKLSILEGLGVDYTLLADFPLMMNMSAHDFVYGFLAGGCSAKAVFCGYNFTYGKGKEGTALSLKADLTALRIKCEILDSYMFCGVPLSTTYIKSLLDCGRVREAAAALGLPYFISGTVTRGIGLGGKIGIPTVNLDFKASLYAPRCGVYATVAEIGGSYYPALTNVGVCPTFGARELHSESYILDFSGDIYDENIRVFFLEYLREEKTFSNANDLIMQINIDKNKSLSLRSEKVWQELGLK